MSRSALVLLCALVAPSECRVIQRRAGLGEQNTLQHTAVPGASDAGQESLVKPLHFKQTVLVCNAYPSKSPMLLEKNKVEVLADKTHAVPFRECQYMKSNLKAQDRLDVTLRDNQIKGTFEVGDLPSTDAVLLLVLEKHPGSPMISFQSFAFPSGADRSDAQLAVIDAYRGNSSAPHLKMADHITGKEAQTVSKRVEQLNFNHVYAVEEGSYDATVNDKALENMEEATKKVFKLAKSQNYVILRTGEEGQFGESLMIFPNIVQSGSYRVHSACLTMVAFLLVQVLM